MATSWNANAGKSASRVFSQAKVFALFTTFAECWSNIQEVHDMKYLIKTIRYFMSWTSWITHYQNYKYLNMPVATQRHTYVYVIFALVFAFLSHLLIYYPFHMDKFPPHTRMSRRCNKRGKGLTNIHSISTMYFGLMNSYYNSKSICICPSEKKCIYTGGY